MSSGSRKTSRAQWVYDALRAAIGEGRFRSGERILEEEVARSLGVSRTPVRAALSRLQSQGLLELAPGGLVVARLSRPQVLELYAMREILEGSAARFAAQHASPSEIASLYTLADAFSRSMGDPDRLARINREFHGAIYEAAHNRYLLRTLSELQDALTLLPGTTFTVNGRPEASVMEHGSIVAAIEGRDPDAAERAARHHIRKAQEARLEMMIFSPGGVAIDE
ncbi:MAG: GntR family transcriptional regulator [Ectothiorhodospiraceae bacterium]|nr:GntR family transcriptional regulator [Ectothiorhodospiraceae bacterium]